MTDKPIRILRVMEYVYPDIETATRDMALWQVQGTYRPNKLVTIRSITMPPEIWNEPKPETVMIERNTDPAREQDLKTPEMWAVQHRVYIMDADGWRGGFIASDGSYLSAKNFDEPITEAEFIERLPFCTVRKLEPGEQL